MKTVTRSEIKAMLKDHADWLNTRWSSEVKGRRLVLRGADLRGADLRGAVLSDADLRDAVLRGASLSDAVLGDADLSYANLSYANLRSANLRSANLRSANLSYANLRSANLRSIKEDFFRRLSAAKAEVDGLYDYLQRGRIDGSSYEGECACFCGTVAKVRSEDYREMGIDLRPDSSCSTERWFLGIRKGDTPANNQISKITAEWIEEFAKAEEIELPEYKIVSSDEAPDAFAKL